MDERRTLRGPRRAGGVDDHRGVVVGAVDHLVDGIGAAEQLLELARLGDDALGARGIAALLGGGAEVVPGDHHLRAGIGEVIVDLAAFEQRVHRHDDRPEAQRTEVDEREVGDVRHLKADAIPGRDTLRPKHPRGTCNGSVQNGVGQHDVIELDRCTVARIGGRGADFRSEIRHASC